MCAMVYILGPSWQVWQLFCIVNLEKKNLGKKTLANVKWKLDLVQCSCPWQNEPWECWIKLRKHIQHRVALKIVVRQI